MARLKAAPTCAVCRQAITPDHPTIRVHGLRIHLVCAAYRRQRRPRRPWTGPLLGLL
jgi:hypothetical protein